MRPGLREALAACRPGDTLVVAKLDRLARSLPDARDIVEELTGRGVRLQLGGSVHDPTDPVGRLLFNVLAMVAEREIIRDRTLAGLAAARARGRRGGRPSKLSADQRRTARKLYDEREHTVEQIGRILGVSRTSIYRALQDDTATADTGRRRSAAGGAPRGAGAG